MKCEKCGNEYNDELKTCPVCGEGEATVTAEPIVEEKKKRKLRIGQLIWSILNLWICCLPISIISLVSTIMAVFADTDELEAKRVRRAKAWNFVATFGGVALILIGIIAGAVMTAVGGGMEMIEDIFNELM